MKQIAYDDARADPAADAKLADGRFVCLRAEEGGVYVFEYETTREQRQRAWEAGRDRAIALCREWGIEPPTAIRQQEKP